MFIEDINDNILFFLFNGYNVKILEGVKVDSDVIVVVVIDLDVGNNGKFVYELIFGNIGGMFVLFLICSC